MDTTSLLHGYAKIKWGSHVPYPNIDEPFDKNSRKEDVVNLGSIARLVKEAMLTGNSQVVERVKKKILHACHTYTSGKSPIDGKTFFKVKQIELQFMQQPLHPQKMISLVFDKGSLKLPVNYVEYLSRAGFSYLKTLYSSNLKETKTETIAFKELTKNEFLMLLEFLLGFQTEELLRPAIPFEECVKTPEGIVRLLALADMYDIQPLKELFFKPNSILKEDFEEAVRAYRTLDLIEDEGLKENIKERYDESFQKSCENYIEAANLSEDELWLLLEQAYKDNLVTLTFYVAAEVVSKLGQKLDKGSIEFSYILKLLSFLEKTDYCEELSELIAKFIFEYLSVYTNQEYRFIKALKKLKKTGIRMLMLPSRTGEDHIVEVEKISTLKTLAFNHYDPSPYAINKIFNMAINTLSFNRCGFQNLYLNHYRSFNVSESIKELSMSNCDLYNEDVFKLIATLKNLTKLHLENNDWDEEAVIRHLHGLKLKDFYLCQKLKLRGSFLYQNLSDSDSEETEEISSKALTYAMETMPLENLELRYCPFVDDVTVAALADKPLKTVNVTGCVNITEKSFLVFQKMNLQHLYVEDSLIDLQKLKEYTFQ